MTTTTEWAVRARDPKCGRWHFFGRMDSEKDARRELNYWLRDRYWEEPSVVRRTVTVTEWEDVE